MGLKLPSAELQWPQSSLIK